MKYENLWLFLRDFVIMKEQPIEPQMRYGMRRIINGKELVMGTCYYPEHWPKENWRDDITRMKNTGIKVVRIAEFAWSKVELTEGEFDYSFFDEFLDLAEEMGLMVIMCTPTATPPAWLTHKYPEALNTDSDGHPYMHGGRRHYNYNSEKYNALCARIVEHMAQHYAGRACVIGWQIDNELNCENDKFYSPCDHEAFRVFVKNKYGTLDALNDAWGTVFWNQTYTSWDEVTLPGKTNTGGVNPHQVFEYYHFISYSARMFLKLQSDILKKYIKPGDFITTNGIFGNIDYQQMAEESLDFITYDSYPNFAYCISDYSDAATDLRDRKWSRNLAEVRAISANFGIMEQQSGANGWNTSMEAPTPRPGQATLWTMQSVAHGADFISYFRWRTCTFGTEIYWHGILDYSGRDNRRLKEITEISRLFENMQEIAGSKYEAKVGVIKDYDNVWDAQLDVWHQRVEKVSAKALFEACQLSHTPMDYVYLREGAKLSDYKVLFYPHPTIMTKKRAAMLEEYVANGGILVLGCRSAYKEEHGKCVTEKLPGLLANLTGVDIPEYSLIAPDEDKVTVSWGEDTLTATVFTDLLEAVGENAKIVGEYTSDYYAGTGAICENTFGKGKVYYYGSAFNLEAAELFLRKLGVSQPYGDIVQAPCGVEIAVRVKGEDRYLFLLNYGKAATEVTFKKEVYDLTNKQMIQGDTQLPPYGTLIVKI